jgi:hypothetical protein
MIEIITIDRTLVGYFENFNELFESITALEDVKSSSENLDVNQMNWRFVVHPPKEAINVYTHSKTPSEDLKEAYKENLPLIEICTGDYKNPLYIALTPNVDMDYLKKKWCIDYCTYHNLVVREV